MSDDDLSPTLGGGPLLWSFEYHHKSCRFRMPADVENERLELERRRREYELEIESVMNAHQRTMGTILGGRPHVEGWATR